MNLLRHLSAPYKEYKKDILINGLKNQSTGRSSEARSGVWGRSPQEEEGTFLKMETILEGSYDVTGGSSVRAGRTLWEMQMAGTCHVACRFARS